MYPYGRNKVRNAVSAKESKNSLTNFSLNASASTVNGRNVSIGKQQVFQGKHDIQLRGIDAFGSGVSNRRSSPKLVESSGPTDLRIGSGRRFVHTPQGGHHTTTATYLIAPSPTIPLQITKTGPASYLNPAITAYSVSSNSPSASRSLTEREVRSAEPDIRHTALQMLQNKNSNANPMQFIADVHNHLIFTHGDRVVFSENPSAPGVPTVARTPDERQANQDRLNLDRRKLTVCPRLEGEEQLRLLNYQHNMISKIQHLNGLRRLIFLDLYDNQITEISGLNSLKSLRVLMLGKNRIQRIEELDTLTKLDVLDLHGNQIQVIQNLNHLSELRVLNLAGNLIQHVDNLHGMDALAELNLRRNRIHSVMDADSLPSLQRLFLSFNEISSFEDIACLADASSLQELSLDGNPLAQASGYKHNVVRHMGQLQQLDMKKVGDDERRIASIIAKKDDEKKRESRKISDLKERRRVAIGNARKQWEVMQGSLMARTNRMHMPDLVANHVANVPNEYSDTESSRSSSRISRPPSARTVSSAGHLSQLSRPTSARSVVSEDAISRPNSSSQPAVRGSKGNLQDPSTSILSHSLSSPNVDYLAELEGDTLNLYGPKALDSLDRNLGMAAAGAVTTIKFKFIDFDEICKHLHKVRARFPSVQTLSFNSTNIHSLMQFNALGAVRRLDNLIIEPEGNPVTQLNLWRSYLLYRLAHFSLKKINDIEVGASDIVSAERFFGPLTSISSSQFGTSRQTIVNSDKRKQVTGSGTGGGTTDDKSRRSPDTKPSLEKLNESNGRLGLNYTPPDVMQQRVQDQRCRKDFVIAYVRELTNESLQVDRKRQALQNIWPQVIEHMVYKAIADMSDKENYSRRMKKWLGDLNNDRIVV